MLKLLEQISENKRYGRFVCHCGKETIKRIDHVKRKETKSCGCLLHKFAIPIGKKYHKLTLKEYAGSTRYRNGLGIFQCDCGKLTKCILTNVKRGNTKSCGCTKVAKLRLPYGVSAMRTVQENYRISARKRGLIYAISTEQFKMLTSQNCFYCGAIPYTVHTPVSGNGSFIYNGIDRVDNTKGYFIENCVTCCKECNFAKGTQTAQEYVNRCHFVSRKHVFKENVNV